MNGAEQRAEERIHQSYDRQVDIEISLAAGDLVDNSLEVSALHDAVDARIAFVARKCATYLSAGTPLDAYCARHATAVHADRKFHRVYDARSWHLFFDTRDGFEEMSLSDVKWSPAVEKCPSFFPVTDKHEKYGNREIKRMERFVPWPLPLTALSNGAALTVNSDRIITQLHRRQQR